MGSKQKKNSNSFLVQGAILGAAGIITKIIGLAYRIPLVNILGDEGQGFYGFAFEIYAIALLLTSYSLPLAVSKLVSARVTKGERRNAFKVFKAAMIFATIVGVAISAIIYLGSDFISETIMTAPLSTYALKVLAPGLLIVAILGVIRGYFQGMGTMTPTAVSQIIEQLVNAVVSIIGASYLFKMGEKAAKSNGNALLGPAYGAAGGTIGTVVGAAAALLFVLFVLYAYMRVIKKQLRMDRTRKREEYSEIFPILMLTIAPVIMSTVIYNISQVLDQMLFTKIMSVQGHAVADYMSLLGMFTGKYNTLKSVPLVVANAFGASVIPSLTAAITEGNRPLIHRRIHMATRFSMIVAMPSFVGFLVLAEPILNLLYRGDNKTAAMMLRIGAITVVFSCLSTVMNAILQGLNKMSAPVKNAAISLGVHLVLTFLMLVMLKWNIYAVIVGDVIFSIIMCALNAKSIRDAIAYVQEKKMTFVIPGIAAMIMGVAGFLVHLILDLFIGGRIATIIALLVAVVVYGAALLMLGGLTKEEILNMPKGRLIVNVCKKLHLLKEDV